MSAVNVKRAQWLARFDLEPLVSAILRNGMLLGVGCIVASVVAQWIGGVTDLGPPPHTTSLSKLLLEDWRQYGRHGSWARPLLDAGVAAVLVTPYVRVWASFVYFIWVERRWRQALFTALVLVILTLILFTDLI